MPIYASANTLQYGYGNPTGRAQGLGYLQELIARLNKQYITSSNSSVNYTITNNAEDFPLNQPFYADFSHDGMLHFRAPFEAWN
jgi:hypothetical protein